MISSAMTTTILICGPITPTSWLSLLGAGEATFSSAEPTLFTVYVAK